MGIFSRPDSPVWWIYNEHTRDRSKTTIRIGTTKAQRTDSKRLALDLYHQTMNQHAARVHRLPTAKPAIRFSVYATAYEPNVIAHHKGAAREREILIVLRRFFGTDTARSGDPGQPKDDLLTSIDPPRVREYWSWRQADAVSARTINREVAVLKGMIRDAVPTYLDASPLRGMKELPIVKPRRRLMTPDEERDLLAVASDPQDYALLVLGIDTLARLGDLLDLKRSDRRGIWIWIADPKNGEPLDIPLSKRAAAALDAIPGDDRYYFAKFRRALNPRDWRSSVRQRLEYLCKRAKVPFGKANDGLTFHWATRRTGATRLVVKERTPLAAVQRLGGWKTSQVLLEIYNEADRDDLLAAVGQGKTPKKQRA